MGSTLTSVQFPTAPDLYYWEKNPDIVFLFYFHNSVCFNQFFKTITRIKDVKVVLKLQFICVPILMAIRILTGPEDGHS